MIFIQGVQLVTAWSPRLVQTASSACKGLTCVGWSDDDSTYLLLPDTKTRGFALTACWNSGVFLTQSRQSTLSTRPALAICQRSFKRDYFLNLHIQPPGGKFSARSSRYLECELHEFRYQTREILFSHVVEEGQQELMSRLQWGGKRGMSSASTLRPTAKVIWIKPLSVSNRTEQCPLLDCRAYCRGTFWLNWWDKKEKLKQHWPQSCGSSWRWGPTGRRTPCRLWAEPRGASGAPAWRSTLPVGCSGSSTQTWLLEAKRRRFYAKKPAVRSRRKLH